MMTELRNVQRSIASMNGLRGYEKQRENLAEGAKLLTSDIYTAKSEQQRLSKMAMLVD